MAIIQAENIHFVYPGDVKALNGVNLSIEAGESVAIIGRNGSGKTTLVKHMNGLLRPTQGRMLVNGQPTLDKEPADLAPTVGLVFQNPDDQVFSTRVWDEVAFGPKNLACSEADIAARVEAALQTVGLLSCKELHPYDLTITERKLLCLASILAMKPSVIVLDEPTTAQDQLGVRQLGAIIQKLIDNQITVITITHDMDFVAEFFNRTVVMRKGEIILDGPTAEVFAQPKLLMTTYVKPSPMAQLSREIGADPKAITVTKMVQWVIDCDRQKSHIP
jgi:energy-coupling factor transport system ATP-binding protein